MIHHFHLMWLIMPATHTAAANSIALLRSIPSWFHFISPSGLEDRFQRDLLPTHPDSHAKYPLLCLLRLIMTNVSTFDNDDPPCLTLPVSVFTCFTFHCSLP